MQRHRPDLALPPQTAPRGGHRPGIPPAHPHLPPYPQIPPSPHGYSPHHSRSLSQPAFFNFDSAPVFNPTSPPAPVAPAPAPAPWIHSPGRADGLPPLKAHRRSYSEVSYGFLNSSPIPPRAPAPARAKVESDWENASSDGAGERRSSESLSNELFSTYMNFDPDELDSRASGSRNNGGTYSSGNETESSSMNESGSSEPQRKEGNKRSAPPDIIPMGPRHSRSVSMDSVFTGKLNFGEESPRLPPSAGQGQHSRSGSMDGMQSFECGNGEFSPMEMKKIMANDKLAEMAMSDPKRVKRILANRQSAARSKERKTRYISELEHKVQTLQSEATTLSAQLTLLQRDATGISNQNNEMRVRLQSMEQEAHLREALNQALNGEVQRLKMTIAAESGESQLSNSLNRQIQLNPQMFQVQQFQKQQQQQQSAQMYQLQQQQQLQNNQVSENEANNNPMSQ